MPTEHLKQPFHADKETMHPHTTLNITALMATIPSPIFYFETPSKSLTAERTIKG